MSENKNFKKTCSTCRSYQRSDEYNIIGKCKETGTPMFPDEHCDQWDVDDKIIEGIVEGFDEQDCYRLSNFNAILKAAAKSAKKHPHFCDVFVDAELPGIRRSLEAIRTFNDDDGHPIVARTILAEEVLEALEQYRLGNLDSCMQELYQVGAVVLRMMFFVSREIGNKKGNESK